MMMCLAMLFTGAASAQTTTKKNVKSSLSKVYDHVDQLPEYPGGMMQLMVFMKDNLKYPKECEKKKLEGRVVVGFIVEKDGRCSNFTIARSAGKLFDAEALRVLKQMPRWTPGREKGKAVRVKFNIPVQFQLK